MGLFKGLDDFWSYVRGRFELSEDSAPQQDVIESIRKGVEFKGTNLWILIFAIFIACLGLNVNSTAVIIGAMLVSPLMGPIIGMGLSLGINDFELLKNSFRNFLLMVVVSLISATLFFLIFSSGTTQSELLARTTPTTNDVFIALFGGLAGMVAQTRKDRTFTVVSGVAIATALMPPLCTAGFGIATGELKYFLGAFYLFCINAIFIAIASYLMTIFLKYDKKVFLNPEREKRVKTIMAVIVVVVTIPSILIGLSLVNKTHFENSAEKFVYQVLQRENVMVVDYKAEYHFSGRTSRIQVSLIGDRVTDEMIEIARERMADYGLRRTELLVRKTDFGGMADISKLQSSYSEILDEKNERIDELEKQIGTFTVVDTIAMSDIAREMGTFIDNVASISVKPHVSYDMQGRPVDTVVICLLKPLKNVSDIDVDKVKNWLMARVRNNNVELYMNER